MTGHVSACSSLHTSHKQTLAAEYATRTQLDFHWGQVHFNLRYNFLTLRCEIPTKSWVGLDGGGLSKIVFCVHKKLKKTYLVQIKFIGVQASQPCEEATPLKLPNDIKIHIEIQIEIHNIDVLVTQISEVKEYHSFNYLILKLLLAHL